VGKITPDRFQPAITTPRLNASRRIRATPYTPRIEALGVSGYSVVNHTLLPKGFRRSVVEDYWHLKSHVQLWDVGCQRQVQLRGRDAAGLAQLMTPRNLGRAEIGQCLYAPLVDKNGGMVNDPIILKLADDHFWLSIADSDVLLWASGLAVGMDLDLQIDEPDVWPLAVQGPKSDDLMAQVFGDAVRNIRFFRFEKLEFRGCPIIVARSGYSRQGGFEIYLDKPSLGLDLWDALWEAGSNLSIAPGSPNLIERIESGLLSYGNEMTRENNPLECGLGRFCQLDGSIEFIGRDALQRIAAQGPQRRIRGVLFDGEPCPPCRHPWPTYSNRTEVGKISSATWSPRFEKNVALAMLEIGSWKAGTQIAVDCGDGVKRKGVVSDLPMTDGGVICTV
jgi:dimethylsulfoniopropionate demethylase